MKNLKKADLKDIKKNPIKLEREQLRKVYGGAQVTSAKDKTEID